ncbi:MAG: glycosyltransferase family 39 protein [Phycisphaerales bacterium]|nr:MAG: glycosyltransferase family 39 protein [Phycisphaerales bacterium]
MQESKNTVVVVSVCAVLALVTFAVYYQVRNHAFIDFDDDLYVTANTHVQSGLTWRGVRWAFTTNHAWNWHPLVWLSHMLDCELFGTDAGWHHLANVVYHIANTVLLFLLFRRMTGDLWPSAFLAGLFALHPLHVESVAWVSERKDTLSTLFWLLTMWFYVGYTRRPRVRTYLPVAGTLALGLLAKQMLVTLPFVLLLMDYWPLRRLQFEQAQTKHPRRRARRTRSGMSPARCLVEKLPLMALSVIAGVVILLIQSKATLVKATGQFPLPWRLGNALVAYVLYIGKMFWPARLGILYPHPGEDLPIWQVVAAAAVLVAVSAATIRLRRAWPCFVVGWLWHLGTLVPVIGLVQVGLQQIADRYTYVPLIGLFMIIAWGPVQVLRRVPKARGPLAASGAAVLIVLSAVTWCQLGYWQNSISLFKHTVAVTNDNDILHYNLGMLLLKEGEHEQTIHHWSEAVRIKADQPTIHKQLGALLAGRGRVEQAIHHYRQALLYKPGDVHARQALAALLAARDKVRQEDTPP